MADSPTLKSSPLRERHLQAGARLVDFAGWEMPVQYRGILHEHQAVRERAGMFDISHMGEFMVRGATAGSWLDRVLTNTASALETGEGQYTLMLNPEGGVIDDLILYRFEPDLFYLVVNASKIDEDLAWLEQHLPDEIQLADESAATGAVAVQGPDAQSVFEKVFGGIMPAKNRIIPVGGGWAAGTGYTGEEGFELFGSATRIGEIWDQLAAAGAEPCGLGARDTLRLEACYPLNGNDLAPDRTPLEAGLKPFVALEKEDFIGKSALEEQRATGLRERLAAIKLEGKTPPLRPHYPVLADGEQIGETTSGALSPTLGYGIALAYLPKAHAKVGTTIEVDIRGRKYQGSVCKKPFYQRNSIC